MVYFGAYDVLAAFDASTGAQLWTYIVRGYVWSSFATGNGVVYIGSDDHNVYALNAKTGAKLWSYSTGSAVHGSSAAVANGVVYVGSDDGDVYALNAKTGAKLWSHAISSGWSSPAVANGMMYIGGGNNVYAFGLK
jgi:outer membrane protein assembly factor BamB